jgi:UDP:flavonoid glycosyltransferase YjiC (YdhE family)
VKSHAHVAFNNNFGPFLNKLTYALADFGLITTTKITQKWLNVSDKITRKQIKHVLAANKVIYTISPTFFQRPDDWPSNRKVMGFQHQSSSDEWQPSAELRDFLARHQNTKILFITFGSMINPNPEEKSRMIVDIVQRHKIPAIINTAAGGLVKPERFDAELLHFSSHIPYEWIFPKMYAVIHHGGSGTTHLSLLYGCATLIIPHIIDQFVWDKIVSYIGAGPRGIKTNKMSTKNLEPKILALLNRKSFKTKAEHVAKHMQKEDFQEDIYRFILQDPVE